jgi:hypothetical protein
MTDQTQNQPTAATAAEISFACAVARKWIRTEERNGDLRGALDGAYRRLMDDITYQLSRETVPVQTARILVLAAGRVHRIATRIGHELHAA